MTWLTRIEHQAAGRYRREETKGTQMKDTFWLWFAFFVAMGTCTNVERKLHTRDAELRAALNRGNELKLQLDVQRREQLERQTTLRPLLPPAEAFVPFETKD